MKRKLMNLLKSILFVIICYLSLNIFDFAFAASPELDFQFIMKEYGRMIANLILIFFLFILVIRPLVKTIKRYQESRVEDTNSVVSGFGLFSIKKTDFISKDEFDEKYNKLLSEIHDLSEKIDKLQEFRGQDT